MGTYVQFCIRKQREVGQVDLVLVCSLDGYGFFSGGLEGEALGRGRDSSNGLKFRLELADGP